VTSARIRGLSVSHLHLRHLNPFPADLGEILQRFTHVLVPEINSGQLSQLLRARYLVDARGFNRVRGLPLRSEEIESEIDSILGGTHA
jgi:2-oxoglutarate ferredoxin oxidoreductase subunit alpha